MRLITKIITFFCIFQLSAFGALPCDGFLSCDESSTKVETVQNDVPSCHEVSDSENQDSKESKKNDGQHVCKCCVLFSELEIKVKPNLLNIIAIKELQFSYQDSNLNNFNLNLFRPPIA